MEDSIDDVAEEDDGGHLNAEDGEVKDPVEVELVADVVSEFVSCHTECKKDPGITAEVILAWLKVKGGERTDRILTFVTQYLAASYFFGKSSTGTS